jgi:hypothetical protein
VNLFTARRLVVSVLLAVAGVGIVYAFSLHEDPEPLRYTHEAVRAVHPTPGDQVLRQTTVFVELDSGYDIRDLVVTEASGRVTAFQGQDLDAIVGLNRFAYTPGKGKVVEEFEPGRTCAKAEFVEASRLDAPLQEFSWCFSLH